MPLFVGERNGVDASKPATVVGLGGSGPALTAVPVTGPPSADPATATSDVFYALQSPGRRVVLVSESACNCR